MVSYNTNIKLLMGGAFCGGRNWNKQSSDLDKCFKIYYLRQGSARIVAEHQDYELTSSGIYFINGYHILSQRCEDAMIVDWLHFQPESVYLSHILRYNSCVTALNDLLLNSFEPLFQSLDAFFSGNLTSNEQRVLSYEFQALIQMSIAQILRPLQNKWSTNDGSIQRLMPALEFINRHFSEEIILADIAEKSNLSPNYFHTLFTQIFDTSPNAYVKDLRLQEAVRQLCYTSKHVREIAYAVGYQDEAYFSRIFSKTYGMSPGKYRKNQIDNLP